MPEDTEAQVHQFSTGAVRGTEVKARYDLIPQVGLRRLAETCAEGAAKYGEGNWLRGIPTSNLLNHTLAHIASYLDGDCSEDHLAHAAWGLFVAAHNEERRPDMHDLKGQRDYDHGEERSGTPPVSRPVGMPPDNIIETVDSEVSAMAREPVANPHGPSVGDEYPSDGRRPEVLGRILADRRLPDGRPVEILEIESPDAIRIRTLDDGLCYRIEYLGNGEFLVMESGDGFLKSSPIAHAIGRMLEQSRQPGPVPGLVRPHQPLSPADQGWDEWEALVKRVDGSIYKPWLGSDSSWRVYRNSADNIYFGKGEHWRYVAYRYADGLLSEAILKSHQDRAFTETSS